MNQHVQTCSGRGNGEIRRLTGGKRVTAVFLNTRQLGSDLESQHSFAKFSFLIRFFI